MTMAANFQSATTLSSSSFTFSRFVMNLTWFQFHSLSAFFPPLWEYSAAPDYLLSKLHWPLGLSWDESLDGGDGGWLEQRAAGHSLTLKLRKIQKSWRMCLFAHTVCANNLFDIITRRDCRRQVTPSVEVATALVLPVHPFLGSMMLFRKPVVERPVWSAPVWTKESCTSWTSYWYALGPGGIFSYLLSNHF